MKQGEDLGVWLMAENAGERVQLFEESAAGKYER